MEELFAYGYEQFKTDKSDTAVDKGYSRSIDGTDTADVLDAQTRTVQSSGEAYFTDWERHCKKYGFDVQNTDTGIFGRNDDVHSQRQSVSGSENNGREYEVDPIFSRGRVIKSDSAFERNDTQGTEGYDERAESQGFDTVEAQTEMGNGWGDIAIDTLYLAADITMIGETDNNDKHKPKFVRERKRGQKKQQNNNSNEMQLKM